MPGFCSMADIHTPKADPTAIGLENGARKANRQLQDKGAQPVWLQAALPIFRAGDNLGWKEAAFSGFPRRRLNKG